MNIDQTSLMDPATQEDPFAYYDALLDQAPVYFMKEIGAYVVCKYEDIRYVVAHPEIWSIDMSALPQAQLIKTPAARKLLEDEGFPRDTRLTTDPPVHTQYRMAVHKAFTPQRVKKQAAFIQGAVDDLTREMAALDQCDFMRQFAWRLPMFVITRLLGVPYEDADKIKHWSDELALFIGSARGVPDKYERARDGMRQIASLFRTLLAQRRAEPRDDLLSGLIAARDEDESLSEDELVAACILVLFGGHETTTNLIGNAVLMLLEHPGERERLAADPGLIDSAVEEFLRYDGPSNSLCRMVAVDHEIAGKPMRRGDRIFAMLNAGNRDERAFTEPDRLDLGREPNRHLTFGQGAHFCIGAPLARLEGSLAVNALLARFPNMTLAGTQPEWRDAMIMRGMHSLRVRL